MEANLNGCLALEAFLERVGSIAQTALEITMKGKSRSLPRSPILDRGIDRRRPGRGTNSESVVNGIPKPCPLLTFRDRAWPRDVDPCLGESDTLIMICL